MRLIAITSIILFSISCTPKLHYLGDSYGYNEDVEIFYDENDIDRDYKVMGQLSSESIEGFHDLDDLKKSMIQMAKEKGADAILFLYHDSYDENHMVQSKLLKYK